MAWLTDFMRHCDRQLHDIGNTLLSLKNDCELAAYHYYQTGVQLAQANHYSSGQGAPAFLAELNTDINTHRLVLNGVGHVASGAQICGDALQSNTATYDSRLTNISPPPGGMAAESLSSDPVAYEHYAGDITPITDVGTASSPTKWFDNHLHYYQSKQLNGPDTALDINPATLGPTEYFPMQNSQ